MQKGAIGQHDTQVVDKPWDGPASVARVEAKESNLRKLHAWVDASKDPNTKEAFKLPHHEVNSDGSVGPANLKGAIAAIAALNGARGGVDIPQTDRRAVWRHLAAHIRDAGEKLPELSANSKKEFDRTQTLMNEFTHLELSSKAFEVVDKQSDSEITVKGFASIQGIDRDGDKIPVDAFDVETYLKNPQLWFNHKLFTNKEGMAVPIGNVEEMAVVKVEHGEDEKTFSVVDQKTGETIDSFIDSDQFVVKSGDRGLWVVAKVVEPEIVNLVESKRLNAFSWAGAVMRKADGQISKIDIREVSLVFLPANARALFMVGKGLATQHYEDYVITDNGLVYPLEKETPLKESRNDATYICLTVGANGATTTRRLDKTTLDEAKEYANEIKKDVHAVVIYKNQWKATDQDTQVFRIAEVIQGEVEKSSADEKVKPKAEKSNRNWTKEYVDDLPDECFAYIEPGGKKDSEDKTVPRDLRHFHYKNHAGDVDKDAIKNSIQEARTSSFATPALKVLIKEAKEIGLNDFLTSEQSAPLTEEEQILLGISGEIAIDEQKGGEYEVTEEQFEKLMETVKGVNDGLENLSKRVEGLETGKEDDPKKTKGESDSEKEKDSKAEEKVDAKEDESKNDKEKTESKEEDTDFQKLLLEGLGSISEKLSTLDKRVGKLEETPAKSQSVKEDGDEEEEATNDSLKAVAAVRKAFADLDPEKKKSVKANSLATALFEDTANRHGGL